MRAGTCHNGMLFSPVGTDRVPPARGEWGIGQRALGPTTHATTHAPYDRSPMACETLPHRRDRVPTCGCLVSQPPGLLTIPDCLGRGNNDEHREGQKGEGGMARCTRPRMDPDGGMPVRVGGTEGGRKGWWVHQGEGAGQGCIGRGGRYPSFPPPGRPAYAQPLSP